MAQSKAAAIADEDSAAIGGPASAPGKRGGAGLIIGAVVLSVAASAGISWFFSQQAQHANPAQAGAAGDGATAGTPKSPPLYQTMEPAFVVNLDAPDHERFLQVQIELMARDATALEAAARYNPRIRNALLLLLGQQRVADLGSREGKEKLQASVLVEIQTILNEETGHPGVEAVYFSSFVMQ